MRSLLLAPVALVLLPACGAPLKEQQHAELIQQLRVDDAFADSYYVDDLACQGGDAGTAAVGAAQIFQWQGDATRPTPYAFANTNASLSLSSHAIAQSYYDFHQSQVCRDGESTDACSGPSTVVGTQKRLKLCKDGYTYPRTSIEGVALSSLANINSAETFYHKVPGASDALLPSYLLVLPTVEKVINDKDGNLLKRAVSTDNLAYAANFGGTPVFVVYPKGKKAVSEGLWKDVNLWEIPWGLAHEFGHHVFRTHTGIVKLGDNSVAGFNPIHSFNTGFEGGNEGLALTAERNVGGEDVFNAINEGYADLFSFYTFGAKAGLTKGVDCFETSRDLASGIFADGTQKVLDQKILATFLSTTADANRGCRFPNFQDVHAVGAVVAYGVERLFSAAAPGSGDAAALKKAALLLEWARRIGDVVRATDAGSISFDLLVKQALLTVAPQKKLTAAECAVIRAQFPVYAPTWLKSEFSCN